MSSLGTICVAVLFAGCATASSHPPTSTIPSAPARPGRVESIDKVEDHVPRNPVDNAVLGLIVGGLLLGNLLFHHGTGTVVGAEDGTWPSNVTDEDSSTVPLRRVLIRFDDGGSMTLEYRGDVPFDRGERVVLTDNGLVSMR